MIVCIPVNEALGLQSPVCAHLGSAPMYLVVDSESEGCRVISNAHQHHEHGTCAPLAALEGEKIDLMVVAGIGQGAMNKLAAAGIRVCMTQGPTVAEVMSALRAGTLGAVPSDMIRCNH
jgi:predicted Fe-Mo cluster-binding NifX family protein